MYPQLLLENQFCFRLYTAARMITASYTPYFKPFGITYAQYLVLMVLWERDHRIISEITECLHLETNTVTPLLKRMETKVSSFGSKARPITASVLSLFHPKVIGYKRR